MYKKAQRILSVALFLIGWSDPGSGQSLQQFYTQNRGTWNSTVFIGADDGDPEALLSRPGSMGIDSKGSMYILDSQECCIKKFDSKGGFIKSFSRKGKGPGELEMAVRMVITGPDQIVVYDLGNRRFTVFDSEGQYVSSTAITDFVWNFCISPKGAYYIELHEWDWNGKKGGTLYTIVQLGKDFKSHSVVDSVRIKDNTFTQTPVRSNMPVPFAPRPSWGVLSDDRVWVALAGDYVLRFFSPDLNLLKQVQHQGKPIAVTNEDQEAFFKSITFSTSDGGRAQGAPDHMRKGVEFPAYKPWFNYVISDNEDHLLFYTFAAKDGKAACDIFSSQGEFIAQREMPMFNGAGGSCFVHDAVYTLALENDAPVLRKFQLK